MGLYRDNRYRDEIGPLPSDPRRRPGLSASLPATPSLPRFDVIDNVAVVTITRAEYEVQTGAAVLSGRLRTMGTKSGLSPDDLSATLDAWCDAFPDNRPVNVAEPEPAPPGRISVEPSVEAAGNG